MPVAARDTALTPMPDTFDYVIANMVFMDIPDYLPALHNCISALKSNGGLIFSLLHPCFEEAGSEWSKKYYVEVRDYFEKRVVEQTHGYFVHRPLSFYINSVVQEGCILQKVIEPRLEDEIARQYQAERYRHVPGYVVIYATKI